jgi:hypothetical protein
VLSFNAYAVYSVTQHIGLFQESSAEKARAWANRLAKNLIPKNADIEDIIIEPVPEDKDDHGN